MKKKKKKIVRLTKGEKFLYIFGIICFIFSIGVKVFSAASISNIKMDIEKISYKIDGQEKKNQSLAMQVNELTSYENLSKVLDDMGLVYNNENIIIVQ